MIEAAPDCQCTAGNTNHGSCEESRRWRLLSLGLLSTVRELFGLQRNGHITIFEGGSIIVEVVRSFFELALILLIDVGRF